MNFAVRLRGTIVASSDQAVESHLDDFMKELLHLRAEDPSIDVDLSTRAVDLSVLVRAANPLEAVIHASGFIRSAIHAAGGATPDWPGAQADAWAIRLVSVRSDELILEDDSDEAEVATAGAR